ncbi:MAG: JAB domain-containing protein [Pseudomonadota bacterium]
MVTRFVLNESTNRYRLHGEATADEILSQVRRMVVDHLTRRSKPITSPTDAASYLADYLDGSEYEVFAALFLDNRHCVIALRTLFRGSIDACSVYPRKIVKEALKCNAAAVIFAHNHPL